MLIERNKQKLIEQECRVALIGFRREQCYLSAVAVEILMRKNKGCDA